MAESTLNIIWQEHQARVGTFLGWGRGAYYGETAWTAQQQFELDGIVASALRRFYFPALPGGQTYDWFFLRPTFTGTLASGATTLTLPDDYSGAEGQVTLQATVSVTQPWAINWTNLALLRAKAAAFPTMTGPPLLVAEEPIKGTSLTTGQGFQLVFFPTTDQAYTVQFSYSIRPDYLSTPFPYAYGGAEHAETILEACLAVAEQRLDDASTVHMEEFERRLQGSIAADRKRKPQRLGYNGDDSDNPGWAKGMEHYLAPAATYNGQAFS